MLTNLYFKSTDNLKKTLDNVGLAGRRSQEDFQNQFNQTSEASKLCRTDTEARAGCQASYGHFGGQ